MSDVINEGDLSFERLRQRRVGPVRLRPDLSRPDGAHAQWGHLAFVVVFTLVTANAVVAAIGIDVALPVAGAVILVVAYVIDGIGALARGSHARRYAAAVVIATALISVPSDASIFLVVLLVPQMFWILPLRAAIMVSAMLFVIVGVAYAGHRGYTAGAVGGAALFAVGGFFTSALTASWLSRVLHENDLRARLITELESTREELASLHHDTGVLAERSRLAGEIHDGLAQGFVSIHLLLSSVERDLDSGRSERAAERVRLAREQAGLHIQESRAIVAALAPVDLDGGSIGTSITRVADRFARELGVDVEVTVDVDELFEPAEVQRIALLRTLQECLSNIRKHADPTRIVVCLRHSTANGGTGITLTVRDDGRGFDIGDDTVGFGLDGIRRRLARAGGGLVVESSPGVGTTVRAYLGTVRTDGEAVVP